MRNRATIESNDEITEQQPPATTPSKVKSEDPIMKPLSVVVRKFFSIGSREIVVDDDKLKRHVTFRVLGMEIGSWSRTSQFLFCSLMGIGFLLMYGLLQEFVVMNKFHRSLGWFITFLQLSGYAICGSFEQHLFANKLHERKIPLRYYCLFAILHVTMQGCTNLAMQYLNYPAKTLFKSSRVIVTMLFGGCFMGKTYHSRDYLVAAMIITGLSLFVVCDAQTSPVFDPLGIFYIALALCADSAILNVQEFCLNAYNAGHDELVYYTYMGSAFVAFLMSMIKGEMLPGIAFLQETGSFSMLFMFIVFCSMGFLGMSCFAALTKRFGALVSAITSTARKGLTLVLSYICFPNDKSVTLGHVVGALIFLGGLVVKSMQKHEPHHSESHENGHENGHKKGDEEWGIDANVPFGVKERREHEMNGTLSPRRRPVVVVAGSVHCEGEAGGGIGGIGIEIETDDEEVEVSIEDSAMTDIEQQ